MTLPKPWTLCLTWLAVSAAASAFAAEPAWDTLSVPALVTVADNSDIPLSLEPSARDQLATLLSQRVLKNDAALKSLSVDQALHMAQAMGRLGYWPHEIADALAPWANTQSKWDVASIHQLSDLASYLGSDGAGPGAKAAQGKLIAYLSDTYFTAPSLQNNPKARGPALAAMRAQAGALSLETKNQLVDRLDGLFLREPAALGKLTANQFVALHWALYTLSLRMPDSPQLALTWASAGGDLKAASARDLRDVLWMVSASNVPAPAATLRQTLLTTLWDTYLNDPKFIASADPAVVLDAAQGAGSLLSKPQQQQLHEQLLAHFAPGGKPAGASNIDLLVALRGALSATGGSPEELAALSGQWFANQPHWQSLDPGSLGRLETLLADPASQASGKPEQTVLNYLDEHYLTNPATIRRATPGTLFEIALATGPFHTPDARKVIAEKLQATTAGDKPLSRWAERDLGMYATIERDYRNATGQEQAAWALAWIQAGGNLQQLTLPELYDLSGLLAADASSAAAKEQRMRVGQVVWEQYLGNPQYLAKASFDHVLSYAGVFADTWGKDQRLKLASNLDRQWASDPKTFAGLSSRQARQLWQLEDSAGAPRPAVAQSVVQWLAAGGSWQKSELTEIQDLIGYLSTAGESQEVVALRKPLVHEVWARTLGDSQFVETAQEAQLFSTLMQVMAQLTPEQKQQLAKGMAKRFIDDPKAVQGMSLQDFSSVLMIQQQLGGISGAQAAAFATAWLKASDQWKQASIEQVENFLYLLHDKDAPPEAQALSGQLAEKLWEATLQDKVSNERLFAVAMFVAPRLNPQARQAMQTYVVKRFVDDAAALGALPVMEVVSLRGVLWQAGYSDDQTTQVVVKWGELSGSGPVTQVGSFWPFYVKEYWPFYSLSIGTKAGPERETLQALLPLQEHLVDAKGSVRMNAVRMLAYAYGMSKQTKVFAKFLDQKVSDASIKGDQKAQWLLARAYASEVWVDLPGPLEGRKWIEQALQVAQSDAQKLACKQWLFGRLLGANAFDQAQAMAQQAHDTAKTPQQKALAASWSQAVVEAKAWSDNEQSVAARKAQDAWRKEVQSRLAAAQHSGDKEQVQRLTALLERH